MADFYSLLGERCAYSAPEDVRAVSAACNSVEDSADDISNGDFRRNEALSRAMSTRAYNAVKIYHEALMSYMLEKGIELPCFDELISKHFDN